MFLFWRAQESQASADRAQRRAAQSETLEALFEVFFRVLKQATASGLLAPSYKGGHACTCCCAGYHAFGMDIRSAMAGERPQGLNWFTRTEPLVAPVRGCHAALSWLSGNVACLSTDTSPQELCSPKAPSLQDLV